MRTEAVRITCVASLCFLVLLHGQVCTLQASAVYDDREQNKLAMFSGSDSREDEGRRSLGDRFWLTSDTRSRDTVQAFRHDMQEADMVA